MAKIPQFLFLNFEVTVPMFTKFLHAVEALVPLLLHTFTRRQYITFWNEKQWRW